MRPPTYSLLLPLVYPQYNIMASVSAIHFIRSADEALETLASSSAATTVEAYKAGLRFDVFVALAGHYTMERDWEHEIEFSATALGVSLRDAVLLYARPLSRELQPAGQMPVPGQAGDAEALAWSLQFLSRISGSVVLRPMQRNQSAP